MNCNDGQDARGELIGHALTMLQVLELRKRLGLTRAEAKCYRCTDYINRHDLFDVYRTPANFQSGGTLAHALEGRPEAQSDGAMLGRALCSSSVGRVVRARARVECPTCLAILAERDNVAAGRRLTGIRPGPERATLARQALEESATVCSLILSGPCKGWLRLGALDILYVGDNLADCR